MIQRFLLQAALMLTVGILLGACSSDDEEKVIRIGAAVSETGRYAEEGELTRRGYVIWEDWVNNEYGGIKVGDDRYKVELLTYDDRSDPETTADLVERLIEEDKGDFLLGPYSSTLTQRAIEVADPQNMIMVEGTGASEALFAQGYENLFAVLTPAGNYTQAALETLAESGAKSVAIAHADVLFPNSVAEGAERWAETYGMEVIGVKRYPQDVTDVGDILSEFKDKDPDVFVGVGYYNDALLFARTAKELDFSPKAMMLTIGPTDPKFIKEVGEDANHLIAPTQWEASMRYEGDYIGSASDYAERYTDMWGAAPPYQSASATAAGLALHLAIEAAGSLDSDAVRTALRNLDVDTFYGRISFDATGKNVVKPMGVIQVQNGDARLVGPANASVSDLLYPSPNR